MFQLFTEQKQLFSSTSIKLDDLIRVRNKVAPQATDQQVRWGTKGVSTDSLSAYYSLKMLRITYFAKWHENTKSYVTLQ